jgi:uncharacterized membrane protein
MRRLVSYFLRGLVFVAPLAVTVYVCVRIFTAIDGWLSLPIPGLGFAVTVLVITLVGFLASTLLATSLLSAVDTAVQRLPFVRLLYSATKDLLNAFVGEHRRFDTPVLVPAQDGGPGRALGFITQESLANLGLADHVTVYLPFSYSLSGRLLLYPAAQVTRLQAESADVLAFIVSGGVTEVPGNVGIKELGSGSGAGTAPEAIGSGPGAKRSGGPAATISNP